MAEDIDYVTSTVSRQIWLPEQVFSGSDTVASETPVALVYNGISHAVMMATPADLEDFALGFSLTEGIIQSPRQLLDFEVVRSNNGIELTMTIAAEPFAMLKTRRRNLVGRTGCGICGSESLGQAVRYPAGIEQDRNRLLLTHQAIQKAAVGIAVKQSLQNETGAVHGAALCASDGEILLVREDVGRHNALDKLLGAVAKTDAEGGFETCKGFILVTSRASYEMVLKTVSARIPILAAVSAPTSLAIELADKTGLTLVGFVRKGRHVVYSNGKRLE